MDIPDNLRYATSHEWATEPEDGVVTIGISDYAQDQLGDVVYVELPEVGRDVRAGDAVAVVESVKTASDIYAPVNGSVEAVNEALVDAPERINESPYGEGWLFRLRVRDPNELGELLDAAAYRQAATEEA
ncbi:MAG TPA: glycine cleavage system protein GcvH [Trueperaceae bacterium]|nr:glycine cleavage system protein GcvH [Trueperaceae bacterium]